MPPLDDRVQDWRQRAARYRRISDLLGEDGADARVRVLAREIEQQLENFRHLRAAAEEHKARNAVLLAEIDTFLARAQGAMFFANHLLRPLRFSADDLREESRICREEAQACEDMTVRRALASRALALAMLGEKVARDNVDRAE